MWATEKICERLKKFVGDREKLSGFSRRKRRFFCRDAPRLVRRLLGRVPTTNFCVIWLKNRGFSDPKNRQNARKNRPCRPQNLYSSKIFSAKIPDEARNLTKKRQGRAIFKPNFAGLPARNCTVLQNLCGQDTTFEPPSRAWSALPRVNEMLERNFEGPIPPGVAGGFSPKITSSIYRLKICVHAEENLRKMWNLAGKSSQEVLQNSQLSRKNPNMPGNSQHVPAVCSPGPCSLRGYRLRTITFRDLTNGFPDRVCGPSHPRFQEKWTPFLKKPYLAEILEFLPKNDTDAAKKASF